MKCNQGSNLISGEDSVSKRACHIVTAPLCLIIFMPGCLDLNNPVKDRSNSLESFLQQIMNLFINLFCQSGHSEGSEEEAELSEGFAA